MLFRVTWGRSSTVCALWLLVLPALLGVCECWNLAPEPDSTFSGNAGLAAGRSQPLLSQSRHATSFSAWAALEDGLSSSVAQDWLAQHSYRTLPPQDYQQRNAEFAMRARQEIPVAATVSEDLFLRDVLPYQHFDEPVDDWRPVFYEKLQPHALGAQTLQELAETVILLTSDGHLGSKVDFKPNMTPQVMAPLSETLRLGYASCTGMAILLADALRSVGVPARIAGVAEWNQPEGGNHNWVEVWTGDAWHFIDAAPTSQVSWDKAWFVNGLVQKAVPGGIHGVYTPVWSAADADANYTVAWRTPSLLMPALDRTAYYDTVAINRLEA